MWLSLMKAQLVPLSKSLGGTRNCKQILDTTHCTSVLPCGSFLMGRRTKVTNKNKKMEIDWDTGTQTNSAIQQPEKGKIYDKKPFKFLCEKGKSYLWCTCGWSKTQPFCDATHKNTHYRIKLKPVRFIAPETKEYVFCNCKQTSKRPFCDGTHVREDIQAAVK